MRIDEIQQQLGRGEYEVDADAVAEAIVRRLLQGHSRTTSASSDDRSH